MSEDSNDYLGELEGDTPAADWRENGEPDPHGDRYHCRRDDLLMGHLSDDQMANAGFAYDHRNGFDSILYLQAMKDRIRWLSRQLSAVEHERDRAMEDYEQAMHKVAQQEAENEALRRDAERWRHIRPRLLPRIVFGVADIVEPDNRATAEMDAAIDEAMAQDSDKGACD